MENNKKSVFETLNAINVNGMTEKKKQTNGTTLTYLSWSSAWQIVKEKFPGATYEIEKNPETGMPYWYDPLTGYMVFVKTTVESTTYEMWLPVMDGTNHAMKDKPYTYDTKYKKGLQVKAASMCDISRSFFADSSYMLSFSVLCSCVCSRLISPSVSSWHKQDNTLMHQIPGHIQRRTPYNF